MDNTSVKFCYGIDLNEISIEYDSFQCKKYIEGYEVYCLTVGLALQ